MWDSSPEHIIEVAQEALDRASAPICYLHRDGSSPAFAVVVESEHWRKLLALIPADEEEMYVGLIMNHGHIEGDEVE